MIIKRGRRGRGEGNWLLTISAALLYLVTTSEFVRPNSFSSLSSSDMITEQFSERTLPQTENEGSDWHKEKQQSKTFTTEIFYQNEQVPSSYENGAWNVRIKLGFSVSHTATERAKASRFNPFFSFITINFNFKYNNTCNSVYVSYKFYPKKAT